ncbi:MAG: hypothetical protein IJI53_12775 [Clostridia bacterium]|nr:hypothetical protein [Clostridia bacterium]
MKNYRVIVSPDAKEDLRKAIQYIQKSLRADKPREASWTITSEQGSRFACGGQSESARP